MKQPVDVAAVYFPSWHPDAHYAKWYGPGFTEWELVKSTRPLCTWGSWPAVDGVPGMDSRENQGRRVFLEALRKALS